MSERGPSRVFPLASLHCDDCGAPDVVAVHPGADPQAVLGSILIARGDALRAWCGACAGRHGWLEAAA